MKPNEAAIRKRTQIANANRTMFVWIAIASALVGAALVVSYFLIQNLVYNEKVLAAKTETASLLQQNNQTVPALEDSIRVLDTNGALGLVKANESDQAIQVILDALPSEANSFALGASLQNKLLVGVDGLVLESLQVDPVAGVEVISDDQTTVDASEGEGTAHEITFQFVVKGDPVALQKVLNNLERSIRTISVTSLRIETEGDGTRMTVLGKAFYEPTRSIKLEEKVVPR